MKIVICTLLCSMFFCINLYAQQTTIGGESVDNLTIPHTQPSEGQNSETPEAVPELPMNVDNKTDEKNGASSKQLDELSIKVDAMSDMMQSESQKNRIRSIMAKESYEKAMALSEAKEYEASGIYFTNALALEPDNLPYLNSYVNTVLQWVELRHAEGDYRSAQKTLSDFLSYIYTYPAGLSVKGADYLVSTHKALSAYLEKLTEEEVLLKDSIVTAEKKVLEEDIARELGSMLPYSEQDLVNRYKQLQSYSIQWQRVGDINSNYTERLERRMQIVSDNLEALNLLKYGRQLITRSNKENGDLNPNYTASELYITNQRLVALKPTLVDEVSTDVDQFGRELNKLSGVVTADSAKTLWDDLMVKKKAEVAIEAKKAKTQTEAINIWMKYLDSLSLEIHRFTGTVYQRDTKTIVLEVQNNIASLQNDQIKLYEKWSLKSMNSMFEQYNGEISIISNQGAKGRIVDGLKDYICPIDTRYLSIVGLKLYNEVYDYFSKELDREQRIKLATDFNTCKKYELSNF